MQWASGVCERLPDVGHFHVVFTLPEEVREVFKANFRLLSEVLFESVGETLKSFQKKNWNMQGGFLAVIHTWGQQLQFHPHLHVLVSGGGFRRSRKKFVRIRPNYLFPLRALSEVFQGIFLDRLEALDGDERVNWPPKLRTAARRWYWRRRLSWQSWVIFCRPTLKKTRAVVRYLARYTSRMVLHNRRIKSFDARSRQVCLEYRDSKDRRIIRHMNLSLRELIARFAQHINPKGLRRVRYVGFLNPASRHRKALAQVARIGGDGKVPGAQRACSQCDQTHWTFAGFCPKLEDDGSRRTSPPKAPSSVDYSTTRLCPGTYRFSLTSGSRPP